MSLPVYRNTKSGGSARAAWVLRWRSGYWSAAPTSRCGTDQIKAEPLAANRATVVKSQRIWQTGISCSGRRTGGFRTGDAR